MGRLMKTYKRNSKSSRRGEPEIITAPPECPYLPYKFAKNKDHYIALAKANVIIERYNKDKTYANYEVAGGVLDWYTSIRSGNWDSLTVEWRKSYHTFTKGYPTCDSSYLSQLPSLSTQPSFSTSLRLFSLGPWK